MTKSVRLVTLLVVMSIAYMLLYCMGLNSKTPWKKTLKYPLWSLFKQGMISFQHVAAKGEEAALSFLFSSLAGVEKILGHKSDG